MELLWKRAVHCTSGLFQSGTRHSGDRPFLQQPLKQALSGVCWRLHSGQESSLASGVYSVCGLQGLENAV